MEDDPERTSHAGRASSWLAVTVITLGFAIGGVGLCLGPMWPLFWMGAAVCVLGGILLLAFQVFRDVVLDAPRAPYRQTGTDASPPQRQAGTDAPPPYRQAGTDVSPPRRAVTETPRAPYRQTEAETSE
ncbi:HGxxPAAW family protein [Streptosporangium canum]|uniref:HGxxPAAW family protein n=1 Tax=Streptosporangium canum TaxID=324952 RepID=UPI003438F204